VENTVGFEDDHEALEAELDAREAGKDAERRAASGFSIARVVASRSGLGEVGLAESQEAWFVAQEGRTEAECPVDDSEGPEGVRTGRVNTTEGSQGDSEELGNMEVV
jgi:hypothetical protein